MAISGPVECIICRGRDGDDDAEFESLEDARKHALAEHAEDIASEEWGHYVEEAD